MKFPLILLICLGLVLTGCESLSDATAGIKQRLAERDQPHTRVFAAEPRATYEAARAAIDEMNFRFLRGGPAQGEIEAINGVGAGDSLRDPRQIAMTVHFSAAAEAGSTEVSLWLREAVEDNSSQSSNGTTETPLRESALYEAFFRDLQQALAAPQKG